MFYEDQLEHCNSTSQFLQLSLKRPVWNLINVMDGLGWCAMRLIILVLYQVIPHNYNPIRFWTLPRFSLMKTADSEMWQILSCVSKVQHKSNISSLICYWLNIHYHFLLRKSHSWCTKKNYEHGSKYCIQQNQFAYNP